MAIGFGTSAVGAKSLTSGTSFTIALSSSSNAQIVVVVISTNNGNLVTSITDGGGNTYFRNNSIAQSGLTVEVWSSNTPHAAASGTITVNVTTGFRCAGVAASYTGVDLVDVTTAATTGSTSPITTGSTVLRDASDWLLMGGGLAAANTFTAQNGQLRNQNTTTGLSVCLIDSNGASSPVTDSATMTAANWGQVGVFLRTGTGAPYIGDSQLPMQYGGIKASDRSYSRPDQFVAPPKFGLIVAIDSKTVGSWRPLPSIVFGKRIYSRAVPLVNPVQPPAIITLDSWTSTLGRNSLPNEFALPDFVHPETVVLAIAIPSLAAWFRVDGVKAQPLDYAFTDFIHPETVRAPVLPSWFGTDGVKSQPLDYAFTDFIHPETVGAPQVQIQISWLGDRPYSTFAKYQQIETVRSPLLPTLPLLSWYDDKPWSTFSSLFKWIETVGQIYPTLVLQSLGWTPPISSYNSPRGFSGSEEDVNPGPFLAFLSISGWTSTIGQNSLPNVFAEPDWVSSTLPQPTIVTSILEGWTPTTGQQAIPQRYQQIEIARQTAPTLATLPLLSWYDDKPYSAFAKYQQIETARPVLLPNLPFISWLDDRPWSTLGKFQQIEAARPISAVVAALPFISWLDDRPWMAFGKFQQIETARQVYPTLATLPLFPASYTNIASNAVLLNYALTDLVRPTFPQVIAAAITVAGWSSTTGQNAVLLKYAQPDVVAQVRPTLATLPLISWYDDRPFSTFAKFQQIETVRPILISALPFVSWQIVERNLLTLSPDYAPSDYVSGAVVRLPLLSWLDDRPWSSFAKYQQVEIARQVQPTLATLSILLSGLAEIPPNAQPQKFALSDYFAPPKYGLTIAAAITVAGWSPTIGQQSVVLKYAPTDFVNQIRPTLATLPFIAWQQVVERNLPTLSPDYASTDYVSGVAPKIALPLISWQKDDTEWVKLEWYMMADTSTGPSTTAAALEAFVSAPTGPQAVILQYASTAWDAPAKFGLVVVSPITVAGWSATIGQNVVQLKYALPDFIAQVRPTLATLPLLSVELTKPAQNAVVLKYALSAYDAPAKFGLVFVVPPTLSAWTPTIGQNAVVLKYALSDFVNQVRPTLATLPLLSVELTKPGQQAVVLRYAPSSDFVKPTAPFVLPFLSWLDDKPYSAFGKFTQIEIATQIRPTLATLPLLSVELTKPAPNAVVLNYAPVAYDSPSKFALVAPPLMTGWTPTTGQQAVTLKYAPSDFVAQVRPTLATLPLLSVELTKPAPNAVVLRYALSDYFAPPKYGLIFVAPPNIAGWSPTLGIKAQPQKFTEPTWFAPPKFGLVLVPHTVITRGMIFYKLVAVPVDFYREVVRTAAVNKSCFVTMMFNGKLTRFTVVGGKILQMSIFE